ncbi:mucin-2-like isoform X2 [Achroia grisella]|uniref:mucin-2-like isoform X2 n=1 Tax=Achroia grisella TaxID=688607 RepID=UPI0027D24AE2|nr:mucin-2-like isoform X2 [Achroia grisella]
MIRVLQLCRAEIPEIQGTWYSANAINDGYSPKPISELFTTDNSPIYSSTFSVTKPIVVLPIAPANGVNIVRDLMSSTRTTVSSAPTRRQTYSTEVSTVPSTSLSTLEPIITFSSTPPPPATFSTVLPPTLSTFQPPTLSTIQPPTLSTKQSSTLSTIQPPTLSTIQPPTLSTIQTPSTFSTLPTLSTSSFFSSIPTLSTLSSLEPQIVTRPQTTSVLIENILDQQSTFPINDNTNSLPPQTVRIEPTTPSISSTTTITPSSAVPNYFVIYQQAPQNIQTLPQSQPQNVPVLSTNTQTTVSTLPPITSIISSTLAPSTVTINSSTQTSPISIITNPCVTRNPLTSLRSTIISSTPVPSRITPATNRIPSNFMIRVVAPKGSITNVKLVATTTKRPTTRRTKKPKKNTYEGCINSCKGRRDPLCANPLAALIIDPNTLKGFPSICHLACHNSYRDNPYEKLIDGRCSRLRTRIMQVNSNTKLRRDELLKSQYSIVNNADRAIVEVTKDSRL